MRTALALIAFLALQGVISAHDADDAQATAAIELAAQEEAQIVLGHPCTYVAQCSRIVLDCPVEARQCVKADWSQQ